MTISTFDPLPIDMLYELTDMWKFQWTALPSDRPTFISIGVEDRIFINVLGSAILFIVGFVGVQFLMLMLYECKKYSKTIKKFYDYIKIDGPLRTVYLLFFLEMYIDLLVGGLVNTENSYLFDLPANWGVNGFLSWGDQTSIIVGYMFFFGCIFFPFLVFYLLSSKT